MAAGTVISGGFPGRVAQEVQPNPKCRGCMHYADHAGRTGVCTIGLRPWNCGNGEAQDIGYAPIEAGAGSYLPDMSNHGAQAREVETQFVSKLYGSGSTRPVTVQQVSLGEEHVHIVKSMFNDHVAEQRSMCRLCKSRGAIGTQPANVGPQVCTCEPIEARSIAKALVQNMSNAQRMSYDLDELTEWVHEVAKAGFKMPKKARSLGTKVSAPKRDAEESTPKHPKRLSAQPQFSTGGHLMPRFDVAKKAEPATEVMDKSYIGDDWLAQFKGTELFKEAHALCEQELAMEEAQLKRRLERSKHDKARSAALAKLEKPEAYDWEKEDAQRTKIRLAKQRLNLKLAEHQQKQMSKAIDNTKHSHYVQGKLQPQPRGFKNARAAHNYVDKLDQKYGASAHYVQRNPNFKPPAAAGAAGSSEE